jgi:cystinosin
MHSFYSYTAYNVALFSSPMIRRLYHERHHHHHEQHLYDYQYDEQQQVQDDKNDDDAIPVQSNDVAFAVHALLVSSLTLLQIGYYDGFRSQRPSKVISAIILVMLTIIISLPIYIFIRGGGNREIILSSSSSGNNNNDLTDKYCPFPHLNWLDYLYVLSTIKVTITLIKYLPQVVLNCRRQSTNGWSIWQILLDMTGGVLSDLQLVLDCAALQDWTGVSIIVFLVC